MTTTYQCMVKLTKKMISQVCPIFDCNPNPESSIKHCCQRGDAAGTEVIDSAKVAGQPTISRPTNPTGSAEILECDFAILSMRLCIQIPAF